MPALLPQPASAPIQRKAPAQIGNTGTFRGKPRPNGRACGRQYLRSAICATRSKAPAVPRLSTPDPKAPAVPRMIRSTPDHLSRRTDWHRCQWQGRGGLPRAGVQGADAFASPGAEVDWSCEDQADWSKRVDVAVGGGSGVSHKLYEKTPRKGLAENPRQRAILDAQFPVLKID